MTIANPQDIMNILTDSAVSGTSDVDTINQLLQTSTEAISNPTEQSSKVTITTKTPTVERPELPSQTTEGQKEIARVDDALARTAQQMTKLNQEGTNQLEKVLGLEDSARNASTEILESDKKAANLEAQNRMAVAKESESYLNRYDSMVNDPVKNARLAKSLAEQSKLQTEIDEITSDNSALGIFKQLFVLPGKRKDLTLSKNANLGTMQQRGQAAINYFNNMKVASSRQEQMSAEEIATINKDKAIAQSVYKDFERQGAISSKIVDQVIKSAKLSTEEANAYKAKMNQLSKKDNLVMGDMQAAIETARLEVAQSELNKVLKDNNEEAASWKEMQDSWDYYWKEVRKETPPVSSIKFLKTKDKDNPALRQFNIYRSRTKSLSTNKPWTSRLLDIESGAYDPNDPSTKMMDAQAFGIVKAANAKGLKNTDTPFTPYDTNSEDPKMLSRIDTLIRDKMKADNDNIEDAFDEGRIVTGDLQGILSNTPEAEWDTLLPEFNKEDLKFLKEGGMSELPTGINRNPVRTVNSMISSMVEDVMDLPPAEAKERLNRQANILGKYYKMNLNNLSAMYKNLNSMKLTGVEGLDMGGTTGSEFELTSPADWSIKITGAYVQKLREQKLAKEALSGIRQTDNGIQIRRGL